MADTHFCLDDSPRFRMIELDEVTSTNDFLRDYRPMQELRMTLVTAEFQTAGRGSGTNHWEAQRGKNLIFSLLTHPRHIEAGQMFVLSEALALAIREALQSFTFDLWPTSITAQHSSNESGSVLAAQEVHPSPFTVKWPNDIYYGNRKLCGMLIENDLRGSQVERCIMGVGVNVNQTHFDFPLVGGHRGAPVSLAQILGHEVERRFVLESIVENFSRYYAWTEQGRYAELHEMYLQHLYRKDEMHRFIDEKGEFQGTIMDVEPTGHLIIVDEMGQERRYTFKEVEYLIKSESSE